MTFWSAVKSKGMRSTWRKTYEYGIGIIVFAVFESMIFKMEPMTIMNHKFSITELAAVTASLVEIYSIFENMESVSGSNILKKILSFLPSPIKKIISKDEPEDKETE